MNFKDNLPLYPPEAYSEQKGANPFVENKNAQQTTSSNSFLGTNLGSNNPIMPLLLKMLLGGQNSSILSQNALESMTNSSDANPLLGILSTLASPQNKKKSSGQSAPKEKTFPDD